MKNLERICRHTISDVRDIDLHFAAFICQQSGSQSQLLFYTALLVSYACGNKHAALDLKDHAGKVFGTAGDNEDIVDTITLPELEEWRSTLSSFPGVIGRPGELKPLILNQDSLLYLYRYWNYEQIIAEAVTIRLNDPAVNTVDPDLFTRLFRNKDGHLLPVDWQEVAGLATCRSRFCIISGGPGTGKTTTVVKILALLLTHDPGLDVELIAPTGKAADRMVKSLQSSLKFLSDSLTIKDKLPTSAKTIHRFLGYQPTTNRFRYNRENRRRTRLVIVDEASMISLSLFAQLLDGLSPECRIILLGDKDQLASVESGSIFGSFTRTSLVNQFSPYFIAAYRKLSVGSNEPHLLEPQTSPTLLTNCIVKLEHSYRFDNASGIGYASTLVNRAASKDDAADVVDFIKTGLLNKANKKRLATYGQTDPDDTHFNDIFWLQLPSPAQMSKNLAALILSASGYNDYKNAVKAVKKGAKPLFALTAFDQFRILCMVNNGPYGIYAINIIAEKIIFARQHNIFYHGRPIMVTSNDYNHKLFNGDIGIILETIPGEFKAFFRGQGDDVREFSPAHLPEHVTAFATTVHKSQGSEFEHAVMIMPDQSNRVLSKEIIYTGITRVKQTITIVANEQVFMTALLQQTRRTSGLGRLLEQQPAREEKTENDT